jgi:hypothetical protein
MQGNGLHSGLRHVLLRKDYCEFACPVIPEVDKDDHIAFCDSCQRLPSAPVTTIGFMNSSVTPASYDVLHRLEYIRGLECFPAVQAGHRLP